MKKLIAIVMLFVALGLAQMPARAADDAVKAATPVIGTDPMEDPALTDPDIIKAGDPNVKITKTVEKTTSKVYTVTKRRVGLVGNRPYPTTSETVDGGATVEKFVNDVKTDTTVLKPDPKLDEKSDGRYKEHDYEYPFREYYTNKEGIKVLGSAPADIEVYDNGSFND